MMGKNIKRKFHKKEYENENYFKFSFLIKKMKIKF